MFVQNCYVMEQRTNQGVNQSASPVAPSTKTRMVKKVRKIFYWIIFIVLVLAGVLIYWNYYFTYSDGYRAGLLQKFSHKGTIFKTYEGEMILSSVESSRNVPLASEKFFFSAKGGHVVQLLDALQGKFVVVHYLQKNSTLPWRGESIYLVDSVRISK